jgi:hypothetical protein
MREFGKNLIEGMTVAVASATGTAAGAVVRSIDKQGITSVSHG